MSALTWLRRVDGGVATAMSAPAGTGSVERCHAYACTRVFRSRPVAFWSSPPARVFRSELRARRMRGSHHQWRARRHSTPGVRSVLANSATANARATGASHQSNPNRTPARARGTSSTASVRRSSPGMSGWELNPPVNPMCNALAASRTRRDESFADGAPALTRHAPNPSARSLLVSACLLNSSPSQSPRRMLSTQPGRRALTTTTMPSGTSRRTSSPSDCSSRAVRARVTEEGTSTCAHFNGSPRIAGRSHSTGVAEHASPIRRAALPPSSVVCTQRRSPLATTRTPSSRRSHDSQSDGVSRLGLPDSWRAAAARSARS